MRIPHIEMRHIGHCLTAMLAFECLLTLSPVAMPQSFRERYCAFHAVPLEEFEEHLLLRSLYFHARMIRTFLNFFPGYFVPDRDFIRSVGDLRSRRFFHAEAGEYHTSEGNRGFMRRILRLRVSADRTRHLMEECWTESETAAPIEKPAS